MFETIAHNGGDDHDRKVRFQVSLVLFATVVIAILEIWRLASGRTGERTYLGTFVVALGCFAAMIHFKQRLLRVAFALIGMQAAVRVVLSRTHIVAGWWHIANVAGLSTQLLGFIIIIFVIVDWLRSSGREKTSS
jgi:hypothetical protein